jgi:cytochrome c oxidase cbb3-type subunit 4
VTAHSTYEALRHFADSWGLLAMAVTVRPGARSANEDAARIIFRDDDHE